MHDAYSPVLCARNTRLWVVQTWLTLLVIDPYISLFVLYSIWLIGDLGHGLLVELDMMLL